MAEAFDAACERLSSSPRPVASADFKKEFASELAMRDISTDEMPNDAALRRMLERDERVIWAGADSFWFFDWRTHGRSVREAVECIAFTDTEYSVRFLYRKTHKLMRQLGIRAPDELYEILRRIYLGFGKKVTFGSDLSFGFGKIDRQRQIQRFVAEHPDEPKSELAMGYEWEYGFSAGLAEMWIDSFAQVESVSLSEWVEKATAEAKPKNSTPKELTSSIEAFLERELTGDVCDAELVRQRFSYEFPGKGDVTRNGKMLAKAGYYADKGLLFKVGSAPNEHFTRLISSRSAFAKGDSDFEEVVWKHAAFRYVLQGMLREHRVLLYEEGSCISFLRIHDVLGMRMADVEAYAPAACSFVLEGKPFTVHNLRKDLGFSHVLDSFEMPDAFYESLIGVSDLAQSCVLAGVKVFVVSDEGRFNASAFLERIVAENEGIPREDMPRLLQQEYGIGCPMPTLVTAIYNSSVYHDDVGDAYYSSMEAWKQEVRNELAS